MSTIFLVTVNSLTSSWDGNEYIKSSISSSIIDLKALAPVFLEYASFAIAETESGSKFKLTLSMLNNALNCLTKASLGSVRIDFKVSSLSGSKIAHTGILPINSGINPYLTKSSSSKFLIESLESNVFLGSVFSRSDEVVKPILCLPNLF